MKKSFVIAALGLAVQAVSSFGQGTIRFNSYFANNGAGIPIYSSTEFGGGGLVGAGYTADLLWSLTPISDPFPGTGALNAGWNFSGGGNGSLQNVATPFGTTPSTIGYFLGPNNFVLTSYTPGATVYFEIIFYQTAASSYANSFNRGHSAAFSSTLATGIDFPGYLNFPSFFVVPEPTTLALAGLGGLAWLATRHRKPV